LASTSVELLAVAASVKMSSEPPNKAILPKSQDKVVDKKRKREEDFEVESKLMQEKLDVHLLQQKPLKLKKGSRLENGKIMMECARCGECKPRSTMYFLANHGGNNFGTCLPGHETLCNSKSKPCRECHKGDLNAEVLTRTGFVRHLLHRYPDLSVEWFNETLEKQQGQGLISNVMLHLSANVRNAAGIHRRDNKLGHVPSNCFLETQEMNPPQYEAILCLFEAWKTIYEQVARSFSESPDMVDYVELLRTQYNKTSKELGLPETHTSHEYHAFVQRNKFKSIVDNRIRNHITEDLEKKRFKLPFDRHKFYRVVYQKAIAQLELQHARCAYSNIGLTHLREYNQISFERKNNNLPHFDQDGGLSNCVFICRIFNTSKQLSAKMILEYFLQQKMVPITDTIRAKATAAFNAM
jgi:hypothetical protein